MGRCVLAVAALLAGQAPVGESHILIVSGIGGQAQYSDAFHRWGVAMFDAATGRLGLPTANVSYLAERPDRDPERIQARSTKDNLERVFDDLARRAGPADRVLILLIGHGSSSGTDARFNLPGPDISATELAAQLDKLPTQTVALANTASASGDFVSVLSAANRVVVTATKTGFERNETIFGEYFVAAFSSDGADTDKDNRVSILEAFDFARHEVTRRYEDGNRLLTEHALLDDNGDGEGSTEPDPAVADGALARTLFLDHVGVVAGGPAGSDSVLLALNDEKQELETSVAELRNLKEQMELEVYEDELETLLVALAMKNREIRAREEARR